MGLFDDVIQPQKSGGLFDDVLSPKGQDNPFVRGYQQAKNSALTAGSLLAGNYDQTADLVAENAAYRAANPGTPEGNELMAAWQRGDGIVGGIKEVAGEFARDWREAPNTLGALRATGKNLAAMGGGIVEQMPNMVLPMGGMLAGGVAGSAAGPIGTAAGAFAGATAGNTAMEAGEQVGRALESAGINPGDKAAVKAYLAQHGDEALGKAATKGAIIGAVDTATMGIGSKLLSAPARAAADRALAGMGVDMADKAAIKTALSSPEFASRIASDAAFQAAQKGARALGRNAAVASLEPAGEFAGEYLGQGVATGDWDTKGAFLEAASALGQSGATFAGQKLYQAATSPLRNAGKGASEQPSVADLDKANAELAGAGGMYDQLAAPAARLTHNPEASVIRVPRQDGGETTIDANAGPLSAAAVDAATSGVTEQLQAGTISGGVPFSSREAAQRILDRREDSDRYVIGPHPRVAGRFSILEKSKSELNALDQANARQTQLAEEEGNGSAQVDAGSNPGQGPVSGGGGGNTSAGASGQGKGIQPAGKPVASGAENSSLGDAGITDAALAGDQSETEVAQPVQQPVSEMPGVKKAAQERAAAARAAAESRGAQIVDEEASAAHPNPTEGQRDAGNYKKGHIKVGGLDISIETPVGATRSGKEGRKKWSVTNTAHYGYIKRSEGADGEQVDVYVKEGTASDHAGPVFVVDQFDPKTGKFDEHKVMLGYRSLIEANGAYDAHFSDRSGPKRRKTTVKMGMDDFKAWLKRGDTTAEAAQNEIDQSTGKLSRKRGESQDDYHRRMASEANSRRAARVMPQKERATRSEDVARIAKVIGVSPETVETHAAKDMVDSDKQAPNSVSRQTAQFAEEVAKRFGKRVVFFSTTAGTEAEGFWQSGNTIFLNTRAGTSHIRLLGHEMLHALRGQASGIYGKMLDAVKGVLTDDELLAQHKDYFGKELEDADALDKPYSGAKTLREFLTEEWMADLSGNRFGEAGFWTEVFTQVENRYGEKSAKGIIARMRAALVGALTKILAAIKGNRFAVDERLGDHLEKIRQALADGFAEYAVAVKQGLAEDKNNLAKESPSREVKDSTHARAIADRIAALAEASGIDVAYEDSKAWGSQYLTLSRGERVVRVRIADHQQRYGGNDIYIDPSPFGASVEDGIRDIRKTFPDLKQRLPVGMGKAFMKLRTEAIAAAEKAMFRASRLSGIQPAEIYPLVNAIGEAKNKAEVDFAVSRVLAAIGDAPTPDSATTRLPGAPEQAGMQERTARAVNPGSSEPAQSKSGAGSNPNISERNREGNPEKSSASSSSPILSKTGATWKQEHPDAALDSLDDGREYSRDQVEAVSRGQAMMSLARRDLESVFSGLEAGGLANKRATEALASHPLKQQIKRVQDNFYDMLFDLEEAGLLSINCD